MRLVSDYALIGFVLRHESVVTSMRVVVQVTW
jgi:hypothetical protein